MGRRRKVDLPSVSLNQAFGELRADYSAAKTSRFRRTRTGVPAAGAGADYHYRSEGDYLRILELSRDFFRNDVVVGQGVRRLVSNVIRDGFTLDARSGDRKIDADLEARWAAFAESAEQSDTAGEDTFRAMEKAVLTAEIVDGDIFALLTEEGSIQLIEAHRVRTPSAAQRRKGGDVPVLGVLLDARRRRKELWVTKDDVDPSQALGRIADCERYPFRDDAGHRVVLQVYRRDRTTQTRGISHFAPIVDAIGMHDDIQFAKLVQQQVVSCFAIIRELSADATIPGPDTGATGDLTTETTAAGETRILEGIAPGMDLTGRVGEKISGFSPAVPNPGFHEHALLILSFIAVNLGIPVAVLLLDPSNTNFSGWRGAIDQARMGFREIQRDLIERFHRPVYQWKVREWLAEDAILARAAERAKIDLFAHLWHQPTWDYIEPLKDASADLLRTRNLLVSQRRRCAERGFSWDDLSTEIIEDNAALIEKAHRKAEQLNKRYPTLGIGWREIACLPTPDGFTAQLPGGDTGGKSATGDDEGDGAGKPPIPENNSDA